MSDILERLHNCPNCGGTLQDDGCCRFCGSKVYDFTGLDVDGREPSFIRMKWQGHIIHFKARIQNFSLSVDDRSSSLYADNCVITTKCTPEISGAFSFNVVDDMIIEDIKKED